MASSACWSVGVASPAGGAGGAGGSPSRREIKGPNRPDRLIVGLSFLSGRAETAPRSGFASMLGRFPGGAG